MSRHRSVWFTISLALASALVLTTALSLHYHGQYIAAEKRYTETLSSLNEVSYTVNVLLDYGNGTRQWQNSTVVPIGWSLFNATFKVTAGRVEGTWSSFGVFVTSINGVRGTGPQYWFWFDWDRSSRKWNPGMTGAESYVLKDGDILAWLLTSEWTATP